MLSEVVLRLESTIQASGKAAATPIAIISV